MASVNRKSCDGLNRARNLGAHPIEGGRPPPPVVPWPKPPFDGDVIQVAGTSTGVSMRVLGSGESRTGSSELGGLVADSQHIGRRPVG